MEHEVAAVSGFVRMLFIILVVMVGIRLVVRLLLPYLIKCRAEDMQRKMMEHMRDQFEQQQQQQQQQEDVVIKRPPKKDSRNSNDDLGEYVDFEEVD